MTSITNGNGGPKYGAEVDQYGRIKSCAVAESQEKFSNRELGKSWCLYGAAVTAAGTGDYIFYMSNTGSEDISVNSIGVIAGAATTIYLDYVSGTPTHTSATDITPTSKNTGRSNVLNATVKSDTDVTGLTNAGVLGVQRCAAADTQYSMALDSSIVLTPGKSIALRTSAATSVEVVVSVSV